MIRKLFLDLEPLWSVPSVGMVERDRKITMEARKRHILLSLLGLFLLAYYSGRFTMWTPSLGTSLAEVDIVKTLQGAVLGSRRVGGSRKHTWYTDFVWEKPILDEQFPNLIGQILLEWSYQKARSLLSINKILWTLIGVYEKSNVWNLEIGDSRLPCGEAVMPLTKSLDEVFQNPTICLLHDITEMPGWTRSLRSPTGRSSTARISVREQRKP